MARPINPPSASISRTRWPFAVPPIAGLHGMCATVSVVSVHSPTWAPSRAAAYAASHPACPAPITITSKELFISLTKGTAQRPQRSQKPQKCFLRCSRELRGCLLFPDTKPRENMFEQIVGRTAARDLLERRACVLKIRQDEFFRERSAVGQCRGPRADQRVVRALYERDVAHVGHRRPVAQRLDVERRRDALPQRRDPFAGQRRHLDNLPTFKGDPDIGGLPGRLYICLVDDNT